MIVCNLYEMFSLGACLVDPQESNTYYDRILNPLKVKFKAILGQENFARACQDEHVQRIIVDLLECFIGVAKGNWNCHFNAVVY